MRQRRQVDDASLDDDSVPFASGAGKRTRTTGMGTTSGSAGPVAWLAGDPSASASSPADASRGGSELSSDVSFVDSLVGGGGDTDQSRPLDQASAWGPRLGVELGDVRVHSGPSAAARVNQGDGARAFAEGSDIFLGADEREDDLDLLGHEVAHVAQTAHGAISGPHAKREGDTDAIEQEADRAGAALAHGHGRVYVSGVAPGRHFRKKKRGEPAVKKKESANAGAIRIMLRQLAAEASLLGGEINKVDDAKATVSRALGALGRILVAVMELAPLAEMLGAEELTAQRENAAFLLDRCAQIKAGRPQVNVLYDSVKARLEDLFGPGLKASLARRTGDTSEARDVLEASLVDAEALLAAAVASSKPGQTSVEPEGDLGLGKLAAATVMLRHNAIGDDDVAGRERLQPHVKKLVKHARVLAARHRTSTGVRELRVRISDVCDQVYLPRLVDEGMADVLADEVENVRGYTEEQAARFEAAAKLWQKTLETQFNYQQGAVEEIWKESLVVDPPKKPPFWKALALSALKAATGGAAGFIIDLGADAAFGSDDDLKGRTGTKGIKSVLGDVVKDIAGTLIDAAIDSVDEDDPMKGGGAAGVAAGGGGGRSTDAKTAFFAGQQQALITAGHNAESAAIKDILAIRSTPEFAANPEGAIAQVASGVTDVVAAQNHIYDLQRAQTRAKFAAYLVGDTYLDDAAAIEYTPGGVENEHNVAGMVSMEFRPGASPSDPVKVVSAWLKGVNKPMRDALQEMKLGTLGVPMRARGAVGEGLFDKGIAVLVSDQGRHLGEAHGETAEEWMVAKGGGDGSASAKERTYAEAARKVLDEDIGQKSLTEHKVRLED